MVFCAGAKARRGGGIHVQRVPVVERVLAGATDDEVLQWCFAQGRKPSEEEAFMFNAFLSKRGWRDNQTEEVEQMKRDRGFADRTDIQTFFDFHRADEASDCQDDAPLPMGKPAR